MYTGQKRLRCAEMKRTDHFPHSQPLGCVMAQSTQCPGICLGQNCTGTVFSSECFYFLLSVSYQQRSILINSPPPPWRLGSISGHGLPLRGLRYHTQTRHTRHESSGRVLSPTKRPLPDDTQHSLKTNIHAG